MAECIWGNKMIIEPKFACADFSFPLLSHENSLKLIGMLGIEGVDIGIFQDRSHLQPDIVLKEPGKYSAQLVNQLMENNLSIADLFLQTAHEFISKAINHPDNSVREEVRNTFLRALEFGKMIGTEHMTILPGVIYEQETPDSSYSRACDELIWRIEKASDAGIVLAVEGHIGSFCETPEALDKLVKDVKGLTLTLDYTHFTKIGYKDEDIEKLMPYASHFHARGACLNRAQTSLSNNTIDYSRVVEEMIRTNYTGYIGIEYVWIDWEHMNEVDNLSEIIQLRDFIKIKYKEKIAQIRRKI